MIYQRTVGYSYKYTLSHSLRRGAYLTHSLAASCLIYVEYIYTETTIVNQCPVPLGPYRRMTVHVRDC